MPVYQYLIDPLISLFDLLNKFGIRGLLRSHRLFKTLSKLLSLFTWFRLDYATTPKNVTSKLINFLTTRKAKRLRRSGELAEVGKKRFTLEPLERLPCPFWAPAELIWKYYYNLSLPSESSKRSLRAKRSNLVLSHSRVLVFSQTRGKNEIPHIRSEWQDNTSFFC